MHGHTREAVTDTHTHTKTAEHTWLLGIHPDTLCTHSTLNHWHSHTHSHTHTHTHTHTECSVYLLSQHWIVGFMRMSFTVARPQVWLKVCVGECVCVPFSHHAQLQQQTKICLLAWLSAGYSHTHTHTHTRKQTGSCQTLNKLWFQKPESWLSTDFDCV